MGEEFIEYRLDGHEAATQRWVVGRDPAASRRYVVHVWQPAFIAKISDDDSEGMLAGLSYGMRDGRNLYDFLFLHAIPPEPELVELLRDAESAIVAAERTA